MNKFIEEDEVSDAVGDVQVEEASSSCAIGANSAPLLGGDLPSFRMISSDFSGFFINGGGCFFLVEQLLFRAVVSLSSSSILAIVDATRLLRALFVVVLVQHLLLLLVVDSADEDKSLLHDSFSCC